MSLWTKANDESSLFPSFGTWKGVSTIKERECKQSRRKLGSKLECLVKCIKHEAHTGESLRNQSLRFFPYQSKMQQSSKTRVTFRRKGHLERIQTSVF